MPSRRSLTVSRSVRPRRSTRQIAFPPGSHHPGLAVRACSTTTPLQRFQPTLRLIDGHSTSHDAIAQYPLNDFSHKREPSSSESQQPQSVRYMPRTAPHDTKSRGRRAAVSGIPPPLHCNPSEPGPTAEEPRCHAHDNRTRRTEREGLGELAMPGAALDPFGLLAQPP